MEQAIQISFAGALQRFITERVGNAAYASASDYIRDLVRRDYEQEEERKWEALRVELKPGAAADESQFKELDAEVILEKAKARHAGHAG
jgi:antitoxin ParD1/3/4